MSEQLKNEADSKNGQVVAKQPASRFHVDYWRERLYKKTFTRDGMRHEVGEWSVRLQHLGEREAFSLGTANATVAAGKAKDIAHYLEANGWAATRAKFKPGPLVKTEVCTVGEFLAEVEKRAHLKPMTLRRYSVKLRKMVSDVARLEVGVRGKERRAKYDYVNGGRLAWLAKVDSQPLGILNPTAIMAWRNQYVNQAGASPVKRKSAERSSASYLRCVRALFTEDVTRSLRVVLPLYPFEGVKLKDPGPQRYVSEVDPEFLLACARRELLGSSPQRYLALLLCLAAGLRRKEADLLLWTQIDFEQGRIHVRRTEFFEPKTEESERAIDIAADVMLALREFKAMSKSDFVLEGGYPRTAATYDHYRADGIWRELITWLHGKGLRTTKAIHSLRKESGSLIASQFDIEAARQHLGHRDIRTTSAHYVGKKGRREAALSIGSVAGQLRAL